MMHGEMQSSGSPGSSSGRAIPCCKYCFCRLVLMLDSKNSSIVVDWRTSYRSEFSTRSGPLVIIVSDFRGAVPSTRTTGIADLQARFLGLDDAGQSCQCPSPAELFIERDMGVDRLGITPFNEMGYRKRVGVPNGIRTRVSALKGLNPRPLDDGDGQSRAGGRRCGRGPRFKHASIAQRRRANRPAARARFPSAGCRGGARICHPAAGRARVCRRARTRPAGCARTHGGRSGIAVVPGGQREEIRIMDSKASAVWKGSLKDGNGEVSSESGVLSSAAYTFATRFEGKPGTNPEGVDCSGARRLFLDGAVGPSWAGPDSRRITSARPRR